MKWFRWILLGVGGTGVFSVGVLTGLGLCYWRESKRERTPAPSRALLAPKLLPQESAARTRLPKRIPQEQWDDSTMYWETLLPSQWVRYLGSVSPDGTFPLTQATRPGHPLDYFGPEEAEGLVEWTLPGKSIMPGDDIWYWNDMQALAGGAGFAAVRDGEVVAWSQVAIS